MLQIAPGDMKIEPVITEAFSCIFCLSSPIILPSHRTPPPPPHPPSSSLVQTGCQRDRFLWPASPRPPPPRLHPDSPAARRGRLLRRLQHRAFRSQLLPVCTWLLHSTSSGLTFYWVIDSHTKCTLDCQMLQLPTCLLALMPKVLEMKATCSHRVSVCLFTPGWIRFIYRKKLDCH